MKDTCITLKDKKFALDRGESMPAAIWSDFETIVLSEIVSSFMNHNTMPLHVYYDFIMT